ncbi:hypothetical protein INR49_028473 [Caranx melampygus]|nr:hypothetical protein INR49_028473 [Caranx melampygus]
MTLVYGGSTLISSHLCFVLSDSVHSSSVSSCLLSAIVTFPTRSANAHTCRHEEQTWSMERTESMNSDCQSGGLSSSVGTSKCSSPACMARRAAHWGCTDTSGPGMQYGDSYDSLRDSPHSDRYVSALTTPARLSPVEFHYPPLPPQVPTFQITSPNTSHALSLPPAAAAYHRDDDQPLLRCPDSTGSLPSSPYRLPDDEAYETTQEYASSREPIRSRRRPRRNRLNGHVSQRSAGLRDYSSQSFSQSEEEEEEEEEEDAQGESTPFLSMQNMNVDPPLTVSGFRSSSGADTRTHRGLSRPGTRSNGQSRGSHLTLASRGLPSPPVSYASSLEPHCVSGLPHHITAKRLKTERARHLSHSSVRRPDPRPLTLLPVRPSGLLRSHVAMKGAWVVCMCVGGHVCSCVWVTTTTTMMMIKKLGDHICSL